MVEGDRTEQFLRLYASCEAPLRTYLRMLLCNWNDVEDVFQETTLVLWRNFEEFSPGTNFLHWAKRIAFHRVLRFRAQKQRANIPCSDAFLRAVHQTTIEESSQLDARMRALALCVSKLSDVDRDLVTMRYDTSRTIKDVARQTGRQVNTLYKTLRRIRHALVQCVQRVIAKEERA
jgi:RNA polymerase sigma-70 factor, ECF subfamily